MRTMGAKPEEMNRVRAVTAGPAVVVLDDEPALQRAWRALLEECGYRVWVAGDGRVGLQLVADVNPDVVVTDIEMPTLDGRELARALRGDDTTRSIPIIATTGRQKFVDAVDLFDVILVEPFGPDALLDAIVTLVERPSTAK